MYEKIYAQLPDAGKYLERIGLDAALAKNTPLTKQTLDTLVYAHLHTVPFESLDVFDLGKEVSLEIPDLFHKIVTQRRGGFCFELNGLFFSLLQSLGFNCYPIAVRILFEGDCPAVGHRATIVILPDGKRVICDVGFGGPCPVTAMDFEEQGDQVSGNKTFRFEKDERGLYKMSWVQENGELMPLHRFSDKPFELIDFIALSAYMSRGENARFRHERVLNLLTEKGSYSMINDVLTVREDGIDHEFILKTPEERKQAYLKYFGIPKESLEDF